MPPSQPIVDDDEPVEWDSIEDPPLNVWVRGTLAGMALGLVIVFVLAALLNPYDEQGQPKSQGTHQTWPLNLPPCTFKTVSGGKPCPSCGMTTSFALLMRGDIANSLRANAVGTMLAVLCLLLVPWSLVAVVRKRAPFVRSLSTATTCVVVGFMVLMMLRWGLVISLGWY